MSPSHVPSTPPQTPDPALTRADIVRITISMTAACAIGAAILGGVYLATDRLAGEARAREERSVVAELLGLGESAPVLEVRQYLAPGGAEVIYRTTARPGEPGRETVFTLEGALARQGRATGDPPRGSTELGRFFVAGSPRAPSGFVIQGEIRGYKSAIRFFVALDSLWDISGVRVVQHEEDPGLGAEVATPWFQGQFPGRPLAEVPSLEVTRDPMPEDWRRALGQLARISPEAWSALYGSLRKREDAKPVYAVTGATISSRALTDGVRSTVLHFQKRWSLLAPALEANP
jgi:Na+-translocating ferredoxin:NAD+ oxidoreductase subunit G